MKIEVPIGDVIDKITILQIKQDKIKNVTRKRNVSTELLYLQSELQKNGIEVEGQIIDELKEVNIKIWNTEEDLRNLVGVDLGIAAKENAKYNDERFLLKKKINEVYGSKFYEEKSHEEIYTTD